MIKRNLLLGVLMACAVSSFSQTLFTYGPYSVSAADFLKAYKKNNMQPSANQRKAMTDYLDLYINSRLKIREAYDRQYDTLPQIRSEVDNLRNQIIENYMADPEVMDRLTHEVFRRSQKDIHTGHIFIPVVNGDTLAAYNQAKAAYERLRKGEDFSKVATELSQDPGASANKGDIGWITALTLPYEFENVIYGLQPGQYSLPFRSKIGFHILKNIGERKAVGKMKARQILLAFPPGADEAARKRVQMQADSIYKRLLAGDDFSKMAIAFSNDYLTAVTGGSMPDFGVGQFSPDFESKVWALSKDGAITRPFETSHGWHIVKRISLVPVPADSNNLVYMQDLRMRVMQDPRWKTSRDVIYDKVVRQSGLKDGNYVPQSLWDYTDSILDRQPIRSGNSIQEETVVFRLGDTVVHAKDWVSYAQAFRYKTDGSGRKPYPDVLNDYKRSVAFQYYRDHLETYNEDFRYQMNEFRDGNLFFEIMQREVWNRAHSDSSELRALYETNKKKYTWKPSADAVVFFCSDANVAKTLYDQVKKQPKEWRKWNEALTERVVADSARFEWSQIPSKTRIVPVAGMTTTPLVNKTDNSTSFAYIEKVYPKPAQRSFSEAKGLVINDYQALLEEQWLHQLKEKYPVKVNENVLNSILPKAAY